jgi:two-component system secretion response regulator SsrB
MMQLPALRALVVDDHPCVVRGLVATLADLGVDVCGQASTVSEALGTAFHPDIVLLDLGLPGVRGAEAIEAMRRRWPGVPVLVVTVAEDPHKLMVALAAGAGGYVLKNANDAELAEAVARVAKGELYVTPRLAMYLLEDERRHPAKEWSLTEREREILTLVAEGCRDREIAELLRLSVKGVQSHLTRIRDKTGCRRRAELTRRAIAMGLVQGDGQPDVRETEHSAWIPRWPASKGHRR